MSVAKLDIAAVLEMFGIHGLSSIRVMEAQSKPDKINVVFDAQTTSIGQAKPNMLITPAEARYLAERLGYLADKVERKTKTPACACGKPASA